MLEKIGTITFAFEILLAVATLVAFVVAPAELKAFWASNNVKAFYVIAFIICNMLAFADFQDQDLDIQDQNKRQY